MNVCGSDAVPCPPEITDRELQERVESAEEENLTVAYRVPISLGAPRVEKDNKKLDCDVFDIVVNEAYLKSIEEKQQKYQIGFMVSVGLQGQAFQSVTLIFRREKTRRYYKQPIQITLLHDLLDLGATP